MMNLYTAGRDSSSATPRVAQAEFLTSLSNAELLARAERADFPLARELAARYGAALGLLQRHDLHFSSLD